MKRWFLYTVVLGAAFAAAWTYSIRTEPQRLRHAMSEALLKKQTAEVRRLLDQGFDPTFIAESGDSPLSLFVEVGDHDGMERVLTGGADPNHLNRNMQTCLEKAIERWDLPAVELLLKAGADPNPTFGYEGGLLHQVLQPSRSEAEQLVLLKQLIERGANVNAVAEFSGTPLREAIIQDKPRITAFLLSKGANPRLKSRQYGNDPLGVVNSHGSGPRSPLHARLLCAVLSRQPPLSSRLVTAFQHDDVPTLIACFEEGGDPNRRDFSGDTLLHLAIKRDKLELVRVLSRFKANLDLKNAAGLTPLMLAARDSQLTTAQYLVAIGASLTEEDSGGKSALDYAKPQAPLWHFLQRAAQTNVRPVESSQ